MIYEYKCEKCGTEQDKIHGMNEKNKEDCEECKAQAKYLKRILSAFPKHVSWSLWSV